MTLTFYYCLALSRFHRELGNIGNIRFFPLFHHQLDISYLSRVLYRHRYKKLLNTYTHLSPARRESVP